LGTGGKLLGTTITVKVHSARLITDVLLSTKTTRATTIDPVFIAENENILKRPLTKDRPVTVVGACTDFYLVLAFSESDPLDYFVGAVPLNDVHPIMPVIGASFKNPYDYPKYVTSQKPHTGTDLAQNQGAPNGSTVVSIANGTVYERNEVGNLGNHIVIDSKINGVDYRIMYCHMQDNDYAPGLTKGTKVYIGQALGLVGSTGNSDGPHLHFEVLVRPYTRHAGYDISPKSLYE